MEVQREWLEKDYYKILGVTDEAAPAQVTKAYRKLAKKLHPDVNPGDADSEDRFKQVAAAYDVLGDADKRKAYDEARRIGPMPGGFGFDPGADSGRPGAGGFRHPEADPGFDFGFKHPGHAGEAGPGPSGGLFDTGDDIHVDLRLDFADAVDGVTIRIPVTGDVPCRTCSATGAEPGTMPTPCGVCNGTGMVNENQGLFSFSRPCSACAGRGRIVDSPCSACAGRGLLRSLRKVKTRIPAGVADGQTLRLKGRGEPGPNGGTPGDLYVHVSVRPHHLFERDGGNLVLTLPVTFAEAALGADVQVPKLDGSSVTIRIPPGTATGKRMRIRGNGTSGEADIIAVVEVIVPDHLSDEQHAAVEAFADATHDDPRIHLWWR